jgi:hypothetical protein
MSAFIPLRNTRSYAMHGGLGNGHEGVKVGVVCFAGGEGVAMCKGVCSFKVEGVCYASRGG